MLWAVVVLSSAGGVLPLLGIGRAVKTARERYGELDEQLRTIDALVQAGATREEIEAVRKSRVKNWGLLNYAPEIAERTMFAELQRPAILAGVGVLAGTTGSLLSLTL